MQVKFVDDVTPRSDGRAGKPTGVTVGKVYPVAAIEGYKFLILNDDFKLTRHDKSRFEVVQYDWPKPLRVSFNDLTKVMRDRIKFLERMIENT